MKPLWGEMYILVVFSTKQLLVMFSNVITSECRTRWVLGAIVCLEEQRYSFKSSPSVIFTVVVREEDTGVANTLTQETAKNQKYILTDNYFTPCQLAKFSLPTHQSKMEMRFIHRSCDYNVVMSFSPAIPRTFYQTLWSCGPAIKTLKPIADCITVQRTAGLHDQMRPVVTYEFFLTTSTYLQSFVCHNYNMVHVVRLT